MIFLFVMVVIKFFFGCYFLVNRGNINVKSIKLFINKVIGN